MNSDLFFHLLKINIVLFQKCLFLANKKLETYHLSNFLFKFNSCYQKVQRISWGRLDCQENYQEGGQDVECPQRQVCCQNDRSFQAERPALFSIWIHGQKFIRSSGRKARWSRSEKRKIFHILTAQSCGLFPFLKCNAQRYQAGKLTDQLKNQWIKSLWFRICQTYWSQRE